MDGLGELSRRTFNKLILSPAAAFIGRERMPSAYKSELFDLVENIMANAPKDPSSIPENSGYRSTH